jgi:hypothetical protein
MRLQSLLRSTELNRTRERARGSPDGTPQVAATEISSPSFVFKQGVLSPSTAYAFLLTAVDAGGSSAAEVAFTTAPAPGSALVGAAGGLDATGAYTALDGGGAVGIAYTTVFALSASGWVPQGDGPFLYQVSYSADGNQSVVLFAFQPFAVVRSTLPPGLAAAGYRVTVQLCADDPPISTPRTRRTHQTAPLILCGAASAALLTDDGWSLIG